MDKGCNHPIWDNCRVCGEYACTVCQRGHTGESCTLRGKLQLDISGNELKVRARQGDSWALAELISRTQHVK